MRQDWNGKPYYSLDCYCKETFGKKIYKIALDGGFTCPNRDGTIGYGGCIFCSHGGSGEFAIGLHTAETDMNEKIRTALSLFHGKKVGDSFIAYFQAYTGTYDSPARLYRLYSAALAHEKIIGISIATRPDCLGEDVLSVLTRLQQEFPAKFIWIELGLQTIHPDTAAYIRRGYTLPVFDAAAVRLREAGIPMIVHTILGLPGEDAGRILQTIDYVNSISPFGIKLQLLHILKDTDLATDYYNGLVPVYTKEEYLDILLSCITHLRPEIVIHRITGDGPKNLLIAPTWSLNKRDVLNSFHKFCKETGAFQGKDLKN
jgi:radical SAM protein (TIGR01212 family)